MNFQIGQQVVCISNKSKPHLIEGGIYTVTQAYYCSHCNLSCIGIGDKVCRYHESASCTCGAIIVKSPTEYLYFSSRFAPLEDWQESEYLVEELLKTNKEPELV